MVEDNKSTKVSGNPTGSSPSSLETKVKSSGIVAPLLIAAGFAAGAVGGYAFARKTPDTKYTELTRPVQSSIVDEIANEKKVEDLVRLEYQPQLDAAKEAQSKYTDCMTNLTFEKNKPAQTTETTSFYRDIKNDSDNSPKVLLNYVSSLKRYLLGELKVKGKTCPEALGNLYFLMNSYQSEYDDAETRRLFIEKNKDACRVKPGDDYIVVKLE